MNIHSLICAFMGLSLTYPTSLLPLNIDLIDESEGDRGEIHALT